MIRPGEEGWLQIELSDPVVAVRGDRYILRRPSPGETIGGGFVVDPHPKGRHKRFAAETLVHLEALAQGSPADILQQALLGLGVAPLKEVIARSNLEGHRLSQALTELSSSGQLLYLEGDPQGASLQRETLVASKGYWQQLSQRAIQEVNQYHQSNPLRRGMPREELKSRLKPTARSFAALMTSLTVEGSLQENGPLVSIPGFEISYDPAQTRAIQNLLRRMVASGYSPPPVKECQQEVGEAVYQALVESGRLVQVSPEVVFTRELYDDMVAEIMRLFERMETLTAAQVRDHFNTSRRYVLALLEHLDGRGLTIRKGDIRTKSGKLAV
jgi:selenocysteine-specific elongation factor